MKNTLLGILGLALVVFVFTSGLFEGITNVVVWLVTLDMSAPTISIVGQIIVKYGTWLITFSLVGALFKGLGWFDPNGMGFVYVIVSIIISFLLSWLVMILENYLLIIIIITLVLLAASTLTVILVRRHKNKKEMISETTESNENDCPQQ